MIFSFYKAKFVHLINRERLRGFARPIGVGLDIINLSQQDDRCNLNLKHLQYDLCRERARTFITINVQEHSRTSRAFE